MLKKAADYTAKKLYNFSESFCKKHLTFIDIVYIISKSSKIISGCGAAW